MKYIEKILKFLTEQRDPEEAMVELKNNERINKK